MCIYVFYMALKIRVINSLQSIKRLIFMFDKQIVLSEVQATGL